MKNIRREVESIASQSKSKIRILLNHMSILDRHKAQFRQVLIGLILLVMKFSFNYYFEINIYHT